MVMCISILIGWFQALRKKQLIASGQLGKFGKILETIPAAIKKEFELLVDRDGLLPVIWGQFAVCVCEDGGGRVVSNQTLGCVMIQCVYVKMKGEGL